MLSKKIIVITFVMLFGAIQGTNMCKKAAPKGLLISIEGIDGAGKSTLAKYIEEKITKLSLPIITTKEPGGTKLGNYLRDFLQDQVSPICTKAEFLLFAADRAQHFNEIIMPHLSKGFIVLSDRLADSSMVYQGIVKGLDQNMIATVNNWCMESRQPDLTLYLQIDAETAIERIKKNRGALSNFEQNIQNRMEHIAQGFESIFATRDNIVTLNALDDPATIAEQATQAIIQLLQK